MKTPKKISILGSTGSIGTQTCDIVRAFPGQFQIVGLTAGKNTQKLTEQMIEFNPELVSIQEADQVSILENVVKTHNLQTQVRHSQSGLLEVATHPNNDQLIVAIVGTASLKPTYEAIKKKIPIALACKEVLVAAGELIMQAAAQNQVPILPIDSEHAALHQCLHGYQSGDIEYLTLTASGGPFHQLPADQFQTITKAQALKHPNWSMGQKITIDSATLMNKGLEVIEAYHLFGVKEDQIKVVIHPQSIIHSLVEFVDGNIIAQLGLPDMRLPIQYALTYPEKLKNNWPRLNLAKCKDLTFHTPDTDKFPLLQFAFDALQNGGAAPAVLNAANEAAVALFLEDKITFVEIPKVVEAQLEKHASDTVSSIKDIIELDHLIKQEVRHVRA